MSVDDGLRDLTDGSIAEALAASEVEVGQLHVAMKSRTLIGQASGMLMVLLDINDEEAFAYLRRSTRASSRSSCTWTVRREDAASAAELSHPSQGLTFRRSCPIQLRQAQPGRRVRPGLRRARRAIGC